MLTHIVFMIIIIIIIVYFVSEVLIDRLSSDHNDDGFFLSMFFQNIEKHSLEGQFLLPTYFFLTYFSLQIYLRIWRDVLKNE